MIAKKFPISVIIIGIIVFVMNFVVISYSIIQNDVDWSGFAIDEQGLLYIAGTGKIDVIHRGEKVREIETPTSRGFVFTIENGNTIILITGTGSYKLDLGGNLLEITKPDQDLRAKIVKESNYYITKDGLTYYMSSPWGRTQIVYYKDGKEMVVYRMPLITYIIRIIFVIAIAGLCYCLFALSRWKYGKTI